MGCHRMPRRAGTTRAAARRFLRDWKFLGGAIDRKKTWDNVWVNYNELTTSSLEIIVSKGNHPQMALIQVSEIL